VNKERMICGPTIVNLALLLSITKAYYEHDDKVLRIVYFRKHYTGMRGLALRSSCVIPGNELPVPTE
jgi:hypothetical protein